MKQRVLSLLMAIAICLSMLPSAALAEIPGTGTNKGQTEQQITDEQNPDEQKPDEQKPDEQKPAKAPRKVPAAETHTGDHGEYTLPKGATWQGVSSLPSESGYYYLTQNGRSAAHGAPPTARCFASTGTASVWPGTARSFMFSPV